LDLYSNTWSVQSPPPMRIRGHTAVVHGDSMYIFGGRDASKSNDTYQFNFISKVWNLIECDGVFPSPRHFHSAVIYKESMYVFGGFSSQNLNDIHRFCFEKRSSPDPPRTIGRDLKHLLNNPKFSDVIFIVEGQEIYAHKAILSYRSDHFQAMLDGGLKESSQNQIKLSSIHPHIFLILLEFIYTDSVIVDPDYAVDVLIAADQFILPELKRLVERPLAKEISIENVFSFLTIAHHFHSPFLKSKCLEFIIHKKDLEIPLFDDKDLQEEIHNIINMQKKMIVEI